MRRVLEEEDYDGPDLLAPTRLYLEDVRRLRGRAHAFAHVTGGGIEGNLAARRAARALARTIDWDAWERPPVFDWLARHVDEDELRRVFNLGIGFCAVVARARQPDELVIGRVESGVIGVLVSGEGRTSRRCSTPACRSRRVASNRAERAGRSSARERAGIAAAVFALDEYASRARRATPRWPTGSSEHGVDLVVLAGYMHLLTPAFLDRFPERIVNVHPSLLPAFPGAHADRGRSSRPARPRPARPSTSSTRASTPGRVHRAGAVPVEPGDTRRDAARADPGGRAPPAAEGA